MVMPMASRTMVSTMSSGSSMVGQAASSVLPKFAQAYQSRHLRLQLRHSSRFRSRPGGSLIEHTPQLPRLILKRDQPLPVLGFEPPNEVEGVLSTLHPGRQCN